MYIQSEYYIIPYAGSLCLDCVYYCKVCIERRLVSQPHDFWLARPESLRRAPAIIACLACNSISHYSILCRAYLVLKHTMITDLMHSRISPLLGRVFLPPLTVTDCKDYNGTSQQVGTKCLPYWRVLYRPTVCETKLDLAVGILLRKIRSAGRSVSRAASPCKPPASPTSKFQRLGNNTELVC